MDQATSEHQGVLRDQPECSILADMDCHLRLPAACHCQKDVSY